MNLTKLSVATLIALSASTSVMAANSVSANHSNMNGKSINNVAQLSADYSFNNGKSFSTVKGNTKQKAQMFYKGVPVFGQSLVVEQDSAGRNVGLQGSLMVNISDDLNSVTPGMLNGKALGKLKQLLGHNNIKNSKTDLVIYVNSDNKAQLAYRVEYLTSESDVPSRPMAFIDANDGEILMSWEGINHAQKSVKGKPGGGSGGGSTTPTTLTGPGGNSKTGIYYYGTDFANLIATSNGSTCSLDSPNVITTDMGNSTRRGSTAQVTCGDTGEDLTNGAFAPMNDAQAFGNVIFDMYGEWYGVTPLSQKLEMRVHYGRNYENAFWDGTAMSFGDGATTFHPLVSLDVSAHEVSHGVTEQRSGLVYSGESGGMNEAFSDMAGEAAENFMHGTNDWMVGEQIFKGNGALRYMDDPTKDGRSIAHASDMTNGLDVHLSSGVYNKAFYLLAMTNGWSVETAFGVMLRANDLYWTASSTFNAGACGVESAAADLGLNSSDVSSAFSAVGVNCQ
ncbi:MULTISPECIES: M4 family metallopeptidase [unclassified Colwellia]|uniref:M4 family metallopeptidase n=1 Tax=unclassified Colwellia TaxID=196834 RepID=UPI0015F37471|nr:MULTISPECIES: M4 family metallopeptidase [unclassified Colwellia]MBA6232985.1 peptidase M4 family protein [Colwellia sp. MB02u-7]MBA6236662.1 peptidase M4 family protein [Colwellia sp. MB02u-11]MBA6255854.1 peptidase M4 family protein [Colwellia sp. MB3u-28]MBA6261996.1 peptidase M4 family protein [Colwellia sp. MB3u-41]MBA6298965.1 peptidase M4 family protein [Colwellia sp. MB3u-22]